MNLEDYKEVISEYQQKCFELFNENIVLKTQIKSLTKQLDSLQNKTNKNKISDSEY